ncbi:MAG: aminopeptidase P family protein [Nanoarchaeota archaeon]
MIEKAEYKARRKALVKQFSTEEGIIYIEGGNEASKAADTNHHPFRAAPTFKYFTGLNSPGSSFILDPNSGKFIVFAHQQTSKELEWQQPLPTHEEIKEMGADEVYEPVKAEDKLREYGKNLALFGIEKKEGTGYRVFRLSHLQNTIADIRQKKSPAEIDAIRESIKATDLALRYAMAAVQPGKTEADITGVLDWVYRKQHADHAFPPIVTQAGHILHAEDNHQELRDGALLLIDTGADLNGYMGDITRTIPVNGVYSPEQRDIVQAVIDAHDEVIKNMKPGAQYQEDPENKEGMSLYKVASMVILDRLRDIGLIKGDLEEMYAADVHKLFFYHGLGHQLGVSTHDLAEFPTRGNKDKIRTRIDTLEKDMVLSVEPGTYFNPLKIYAVRQGDKAFPYLIRDKISRFVPLIGGGRHESDVLVTADGAENLSEFIPGTLKALEAIVGKGLDLFPNNADLEKALKIA